MDEREYKNKKRQEEREADLSFLATIIAATIALLLLVMVAPIPTPAETVGPLKIVRSKGATKVYWRGKKYAKYKGIKKVKVISERELHIRTLQKRKKNGVLLIEKITGVVVNKKLDGKTSCGNYICYQRLRGYVKPGDKVITLCIYNPCTTYTDDISHRFDYIP